MTSMVRTWNQFKEFSRFLETNLDSFQHCTIQLPKHALLNVTFEQPQDAAMDESFLLAFLCLDFYYKRS